MNTSFRGYFLLVCASIALAQTNNNHRTIPGSEARVTSVQPSPTQPGPARESLRPLLIQEGSDLFLSGGWPTIGYNLYWDSVSGGWKYATSNAGTLTQQDYTNNGYAVYVAPPGTATGAATIMNAMFITAGANMAKVGMGTTNPQAPLQIGADFTLYGAWPTMGYNLYYDGAWKHSTTNSGSVIQQDYANNGMVISVAASGTAGTAATLSPAVFVASNGKVGIGTTSPAQALDVNGNVRVGGVITFVDGTTQNTAWKGVLCGGDYAESVRVSGERTRYEPGDVMIIDPERPESFLKSAAPYVTTVAGIYSTKPGAVGRRTTDVEKAKMEVPMAMIGIVPTKVTVENGPIRVGDLLVTSSTPGYAMRGTDRSKMLGAVLGKALGSLDSGNGVINVLVTLQ